MAGRIYIFLGPEHTVQLIRTIERYDARKIINKAKVCMLKEQGRSKARYLAARKEISAWKPAMLHGRYILGSLMKWGIHG